MNCISLNPEEKLLLDSVEIPTETAVFPLANSLLFPNAVQALHIFEPRYVSMVENAIAGNGCISMALLKPGYEKDYHAHPRSTLPHA